MPFDHFDLIAGLYDRAAKYMPSALLLRLLALPAPGLLLDAGGGTGRLAAALRSSVREAIVVDLSRGMLRQAIDKGVAIVQAPLESLPFADETFERVVMMDAFHHVRDQRRTLKELWRVLSPGGRMVIVEPDIRSFAVKLIALGEKLLLMRSHFLTGQEISELLAEEGGRISLHQDGWNILVLVEKILE